MFKLQNQKCANLKPTDVLLKLDSDCSSNLEFRERKIQAEDFPGGLGVKNPPPNAGNAGSIPGPGGSHMLWDK